MPTKRFKFEPMFDCPVFGIRSNLCVTKQIAPLLFASFRFFLARGDWMWRLDVVDVCQGGFVALVVPCLTRFKELRSVRTSRKSYS